MAYLKRFAALFLILAMLLSLAACAGNDRSVRKNRQTEESSSEKNTRRDGSGTERTALRGRHPEKEKTDSAENYGTPEDENRALEGIWHTDLDMKGLFLQTCQLEELTEVCPSYEKYEDTEMRLTLNMKFENGMARLSADEKTMGDTMETMKNILTDVMVDMTYLTGEEDGCSREETDLDFEEKYGVSVEKYMARQAEAELKDMDFSAIAADIMSGYYLAEDGTLYVSADEKDILEKKNGTEYEMQGNELRIILGEGTDEEEMELLGCRDGILVFHR